MISKVFKIKKNKQIKLRENTINKSRKDKLNQINHLESTIHENIHVDKYLEQNKLIDEKEFVRNR